LAVVLDNFGVVWKILAWCWNLFRRGVWTSQNGRRWGNK